VHEFLEIDLEEPTVRLLRRRDHEWHATDRSDVIAIAVTDVVGLL
jgi:hypothetical protein